MIAPADENVVGLDVTMHDARVMGEVERVCDGAEDAQRAAGVELSGADQLLQRWTLDEPHGDEQDPVGLACLVDRDDVRMVESALGDALAAEALPERDVLAEGGGDQFERDGAFERQLGCLEHHPHAPLAEAPLQSVAADHAPGPKVHRGRNTTCAARAIGDRGGSYWADAPRGRGVPDACRCRGAGRRGGRGLRLRSRRRGSGQRRR